MTTPEKTLLILGIIFFAALVVALFVFIAKGKKVTPLLGFFILPIVMIGFSEIKVWKGAWGEFDLKGVNDYANNPNSSNSIAAFNQTLDQIERVRAANPATPIPPQIHSNLLATVRMLSLRSNLTPESKLALSRAQLFLGQTNEAANTVNSAVKANTNLLRSINPRLRMLLKPSYSK